MNKYLNPFKRFLKYNVAAGIATLFDLFFLWFFTELIGIFYLISASLAFLIGTLINYLINRFWNFKDSKTKLLLGFFSFATIGITSLLITVLIMYFFVELMNVHYFIARIIALIATVIWSYILVSLITFKKPLLE